MGRKTLLNSARQKIIVDSLKDGHYDNVAYVRAGISDRCYYKWIERGTTPRLKKDGKPYAEDLPFVQFVQAITRARVEGEAWHVENWRNHAKNDGRLSVEYLARKYPDKWAKTERIDVTSNKKEVKGFVYLTRGEDGDNPI